jgi:hypothetical protein
LCGGRRIENRETQIGTCLAVLTAQDYSSLPHLPHPFLHTSWHSVFSIHWLLSLHRRARTSELHEACSRNYAPFPYGGAFGFGVGESGSEKMRGAWKQMCNTAYSCYIATLSLPAVIARCTSFWVALRNSFIHFASAQKKTPLRLKSEKFRA